MALEKETCFHSSYYLDFIGLNSLQLQMDKLPSRHAIMEVMSWISLMETIIAEDEENIKNVVGHKTIQDYLQKYKVINWLESAEYLPRCEN